MALFVETRGRVGSFTVVKPEVFEDKETKRKVMRPGFSLRTVWAGSAPGFVSTTHLPASQQAAARAVWGDGWKDKLDKEIEIIGKSNGLMRVEETKEALEAFQSSQSPHDPQATGARGIGQKKIGEGSRPLIVNIVPFRTPAPEPPKGK